MTDDTIAYFEDETYDGPPPYARLTSSVDFGIVILIARTAGDDGEPGVAAPVVFHRAEFVDFMAQALVKMDPAMRARIDAQVAARG